MSLGQTSTNIKVGAVSGAAGRLELASNAIEWGQHDGCIGPIDLESESAIAIILDSAAVQDFRPFAN